MLAAAGLKRPDDLGPHHLVRRVSATEVKQFSQLHVFLKAGSLLDGSCEVTFYTDNWSLASPDSFDAMAPVMA